MNARNTKEVSIPTYMLEELSDISEMTGYPISSIIMKAIEREIHRFNTSSTQEGNLYLLGKFNGGGEHTIT